MKALIASFLIAAVTVGSPEAASAQDARVGRHALIIGVGSYGDARIAPLRGVVHDVENAKQIAESMGVPASNLRMLRDRDASYSSIRTSLRELASRVRDGDRVFLYYSGHGARYAPPDAPGSCKEALVPSDVDAGSKAGLLTQEEIAADLAPVYAKADKVFIFIDACHSGGVRAMTRAPGAGREAEEWSPKFTNLDANVPCRLASNVRTRSVTDSARGRGAPARNVVQLSSSQPDEVSLDSPQTGGLATSSWKYCSTYADDTDGSGTLSVAEIADCIQRRMDERLAGNARFTGQKLLIAGNSDFAPALSRGPPANLDAASSSTDRSPQLSAPAMSAALPVVNTIAKAARFPLDSVLAQSDERHVVTVQHTRQPLRIGRDYFDLSVSSSRGGYVYLILQSSDHESTYVLFPNALDRENKVRAGEALRLPRPSWRLLSKGPAGVNRLLVVVTDAPRDLRALRVQPEGPFVRTFNDLPAAQSLAWVLGSAARAVSGDCARGLAAKDLIAVDDCSDSFGAAIVQFEER